MQPADIHTNEEKITDDSFKMLQDGLRLCCHWFNGDWIVQPWDTKLVLKVQRRLGVVT